MLNLIKGLYFLVSPTASYVEPGSLCLQHETDAKIGLITHLCHWIVLGTDWAMGTMSPSMWVHLSSSLH